MRTSVELDLMFAASTCRFLNLPQGVIMPSSTGGSYPGVSMQSVPARWSRHLGYSTTIRGGCMSGVWWRVILGAPEMAKALKNDATRKVRSGLGGELILRAMVLEDLNENYRYRAGAAGKISA